MDKLLNRIVNISIVVACAVLTYHVAVTQFRAAHNQKQPDYQKGTTIHDSLDLGFRSARRTLLVVTSSKCHFCLASMPFYRRLTDLAHNAGIRIVGVAAEDADVNRKFLNENGLYIDSVGSTKANNLVVHATPTLILVDTHGKVLASWEGLIPPEKEQATIAVVTSKT